MLFTENECDNNVEPFGGSRQTSQNDCFCLQSVTQNRTNIILHFEYSKKNRAQPRSAKQCVTK